MRKFKTKHQLIALLFGQLAGANSLRAIETAMASHRARLYHAGGRIPARSTFAGANRIRSPLVFTGLFEHLPGMAGRGLRREMRDAARLIDSTGLHLAGLGAEWASAEVCGAKVHLVYDPHLAQSPTL